MADDMHIDAAQLNKLNELGKGFEAHTYDVEQYVKEFTGKTGDERIHDGFGLLTEPEEAASAYIKLAEHMTKSLGNLHRPLDAIGRPSPVPVMAAFAGRNGGTVRGWLCLRCRHQRDHW
ncbi:hypothetical protein [Streptomyces sp. NPDC059008]|uniref:hypothetical protein n=1 Tax=Streptomyces sp. NPDC059008 TaxID=3346693 RepID=UPI0036C051F3